MHKKRMVKLYVMATFVLCACAGGENYVPKPHAYPRMTLPEKKYEKFEKQTLPYSFEIPEYSKMEKDTVGDLTKDPTWYNLNFKPFDATLHITYYKFGNWNFFDSLIYDTRKLVNKHIQRAEDIIEEPVHLSKSKVYGVFFRIEGNTATNLNFYVTDSAKNFMRGALYFNSRTQQDSIAPVYEYLRKDIVHLVETLQWK